MQMQKLGTSDLSVSRVCLGTMTWGEQNNEAQAHAQLDYARSRGINFIDAAEMYPVPPRAQTQGATETILGNWLARQVRDQLVVATKVTGPGRGFTWVRGGDLRLARSAVRAAVEGSLRRLRTEYIDLYQIHWPERYVPAFGNSFYDPTQERDANSIALQLQMFSELIEEGKIRYLGLSNETPWGVCQWLKAAAESGLPRPVSIQNAFSLLNRAYEMGLSEVTRQENIPLLAYSPLAFGHLTGKYLGGALPAGARLTLFPPFGQRYTKPNVPEATAQYAALARQLGLSPAALALAFVYSRWFVASTIIGGTTLEQLQENIDCAATVLGEATFQAIDEIYQRFPNPAI